MERRLFVLILVVNIGAGLERKGCIRNSIYRSFGPRPGQKQPQACSFEGETKWVDLFGLVSLVSCHPPAPKRVPQLHCERSRLAYSEEQIHAVHVAHLGGHVDRQIVVLVVDAQQLFALGALEDDLDHLGPILLGGVKECSLVVLIRESL